MTTGSAAMRSYDKFKERKQALKDDMLERLDTLAAFAPHDQHPEAEADRTVVREGIEQYDQMVDELVKLKPDVVKMVASLSGSEETEHSGSRPEVCVRCLKILTSTPAQLERYIEMVAPSAAWSGWSRDLFVTKMRDALKVGDEIVFIQVGAVAVRRADNSTFVVYARES
jgi:hypothetical protein